MSTSIERLGVVTTADAVLALGVSRHSVLRAVRQGRLRCTRTPGGHCLYLASDIEAYQRWRARGGGRVEAR